MCDDLYLYVVLIAVFLGTMFTITAIFLKAAKKEIQKQLNAIIAKQDAIMAKLIEIKHR